MTSVLKLFAVENKIKFVFEPHKCRCSERLKRSKVEHRSDEEEVISLPFYGGAKGQVLQIKRKPDGSVTSEIVKQDPTAALNEFQRDMSSFQQNLANIQKAASELVSLQQNIKLSGKLTETDHRLYAENLEKLGISAQNLAHIQQTGGQDDFRLLFEGPLGIRKHETLQEDLSGEKVESAEMDTENEEENVGEEDGTSSSTTAKPESDDSVQVNVPDKEASVAEAKPVGLAIAGEGGIASSKPVATAVVGPGGLAVARPVATAIAGISPSEVSGLGIPIGSKYKGYFRGTPLVRLPNTKKYGLATGFENNVGILVGPNFSHESRINEKDITAVEDQSIKMMSAEDETKTTISPSTAEQNEGNTQLPHENELIPPLQPTAAPIHSPIEPYHHVQYPFIPPVSPYRFNWDTEPIEPSGYEPIPFFDQRAYNFPQFYPFPNVLPLNPYQFQNRY